MRDLVSYDLSALSWINLFWIWLSKKYIFVRLFLILTGLPKQSVSIESSYLPGVSDLIFSLSSTISYRYNSYCFYCYYFSLASYLSSFSSS